VTRVVARPAAPSGPTWRPRNVNIQQQRASRRSTVSFRPPPAVFRFSIIAYVNLRSLGQPSSTSLALRQINPSLARSLSQSVLAAANPRSTTTPRRPRPLSPRFDSYLPPRIINREGEKRKKPDFHRPTSRPLTHSVCLAASWILDSQSRDNSHKRQEVCLLLFPLIPLLAPHCDCDHSLIGRQRRSTFQRLLL
jgi:hypothetical protein